MKKPILLFFMVVMMLSCGSSKVERQTQKTFKGNWTLTNIELPSALVDVSLFGDADTRCFEYSEWKFVPNNNKGTYQLFQENCNPGTRSFHWNVEENTETGEFYFTLKKEVDGVNIRQEKRGVRLELVSLDETQMQWKHTVSHEGKPFTIRMNFSKN